MCLIGSAVFTFIGQHPTDRQTSIKDVCVSFAKFSLFLHYAVISSVRASSSHFIALFNKIKLLRFKL